MVEKTETARHKYEVLQDFTRLLQQYDLMALKSSYADEYEGEALSILSRFTESALHVAEDEKAAFDVALNIVTECFSFWFDALGTDINFEGLTLELLTIYVNSYPELIVKAKLIG